MYFILVSAIENVLKAVLTDAENAVIIAIELQTAAAAATRDHTKKLRQAMDLHGEVTSCLYAIKDQLRLGLLAWAAGHPH